MEILWLAIVGLGLISMFFRHIEKSQENKLKELELKNRMAIREMELKTKMLELEIEKQNGHVKLLEEENKKYDRIIYDLERDTYKNRF